MNKQQFLNKLGSLIAVLPLSERSKALQFYAEIIDDRVEAGEKEEEVIAGLGDINELARKIFAENPPRRSTASKVWITIALILGSPLWLSLGLAVAILILSLYIVAWSVLISLYAVVLSLLIIFVVGFFSTFFFLFHSPLAGFFQIGASLFCGGLGIFAAFGVVALTKLLIKATSKLSSKLVGVWNRRVVRRHE